MDKLIRKLGEVMNTQGLKTIDYSDGTVTVRLERDTDLPLMPPPPPVPKERKPRVVKAAAKVTPQPEIAVDVPTPKQKVLEIHSPIAGIFQDRLEEDDDALIAIGQTIKKGDVLCYVEVGDDLHEIIAEQGGIVTEVLVKHNRPVALDQIMFKLQA